MCSLLENGILLDISEQAPSPSKDYINMRVTLKDIQWRTWKISPQCLKPDVLVTPNEAIFPLEDLVHDLDLQSEIKRIFGKNTLEYVKNLCEGKYNFLDRLKKSLQIYIISFLELEDVAKLSQVNRHFHELCECDQLWEHIVDRCCDTVTPDMKLYAQEVGYKQMFFTNKLQLQMQMRRRKQECDA
ncbi:F-box only protein 36-like [Styela clava]|uniref:F-box only protein 36-like n=1 Tax=Styela clava TaxID=7725 RepID=UPI00193A8C7D|nr:F-box only protein 36-like [Styela clava]